MQQLTGDEMLVLASDIGIFKIATKRGHEGRPLRSGEKVSEMKRRTASPTSNGRSPRSVATARNARRRPRSPASPAATLEGARLRQLLALEQPQEGGAARRGTPCSPPPLGSEPPPAIRRSRLQQPKRQAGGRPHRSPARAPGRHAPARRCRAAPWSRRSNSGRRGRGRRLKRRRRGWQRRSRVRSTAAPPPQGSPRDCALRRGLPCGLGRRLLHSVMIYNLLDVQLIDVPAQANTLL